MNVLFFVHPTYFYLMNRNNRKESLRWIRDLAIRLQEKGCAITFFDPRCHKIADFQCVHVFSGPNGFTWKSIREMNPNLFITPPHLLRSDTPRKATLFLLRVLKAFFQRRWPPRDEIFYLNSGSQYIVFSEDCLQTLKQDWKVDPKKVFVSSPDLNKAAEFLSQTYLRKFSPGFSIK